jgi:Na+-transporting methylmalonyl-CoA/oxaloacetate decarboxylase gamma subunit
MEAIVFGFLAYFGSEIGEFTHRQYNEHIKCKMEVCEEQVELEQIITITIEHNDTVVSETRIGESNE